MKRGLAARETAATYQCGPRSDRKQATKSRRRRQERDEDRETVRDFNGRVR